jgi:hypothetical protein
MSSISSIIHIYILQAYSLPVYREYWDWDEVCEIRIIESTMGVSYNGKSFRVYV